ncbi:hypothetical protein [Christiangramia forsetii]|uniref:Uncharacterized protein n=2 Tax=Christiangramia forsetii TaxID=411153 RepID=A0M483_CHRFK|nr:hypothetical protein [Christiangramia forsetii]GGG24034.1 hypothetical protein GCM10011532_04070 [Christiangramia forsetii]CAL67428.1 hypothetical protein GFO_2472 [Christiangramia forsetii KT0803]
MRPSKLNKTQKEFIWDNHKISTLYLGRLFQVSPDTIRRCKKEKGLQDKRYISTPESISRRNKSKIEDPEINTKPTLYEWLDSQGIKNVSQGIRFFGSGRTMRKKFESEIND